MQVCGCSYASNSIVNMSVSCVRLYFQFEDYMGQVERNTHIARSTSETLARTQAVAADTGVCTITDHVIGK